MKDQRAIVSGRTPSHASHFLVWSQGSFKVSISILLVPQITEVTVPVVTCYKYLSHLSFLTQTIIVSKLAL